MLAAAGLALAGVAFGPPSELVAIEWDAPASCPSADAIADDLTRLTDGALAVSSTAAWRVRARVREESPTFALELSIERDGGIETRTLASERCDVLARAAALMIAVAVAPVEAASHVRVPISVPAPPAIAEPTPVGAPAREAAVAVPTKPPPSRSWSHRAVLAAWVGPSVATLPSTSAIVGGDLGWRIGPIGVQLSGWHVFAASASIEPGIGVRASTSGGGARLAITPRVGPVELPLSVGVELGALSGHGTGERVRPTTVRQLEVSLGIGAGVAWPARSRIALLVRADALVGLRRPGIHLDTAADPRTVFRTPPVGLRLLVGPMVRLP